MAKVPTKYLDVDPWAIVETGFHAERSQVSESLFAVANEYMGVRGCFEEGYSGKTMHGAYFNGVYEEKPVNHIVNFPGLTRRECFMVNSLDWLWCRIEAADEKLDLATAKISDFSRRLDLKTGIMTRSFTWHLPGNRAIKLRFERFTSMVSHRLGCQRISFESVNYAGALHVRLGLDFSPIHHAAGESLWQVERKEVTGVDRAAILGRTKGSGQRLFSAFQVTSLPAARSRPIDEPSLVGLDYVLPLAKGQSGWIEKKVVNLTLKDRTLDTAAAWSAGTQAFAELAQRDFAKEQVAHLAFWERFWAGADITIEGDDALQQGVRYAIFQLTQTYHGVDPTLNIGAKGLTGEIYSGAAWWDTETHCLPFYLFTNPKAARNLLGFRHATLPGALERAKQVDCQGARYPMVTIDGSESCGVWQHGDLEIHVSVAVAYGIWHYLQVCGDEKFLHAQGMEMLLQIARFYHSRGGWDPRTGEFGLHGVMGPDEFHMMVSNNCYTNWMVKRLTEWTLAKAKEMQKKAPAEWKRVAKKVGLEKDELAAWALMAKKMRIPRDPKTGVYEQHDGYFHLPHVDVKTIPPEQFPLYWNWAYERIFRYDMIKQPDVLLLPFFFSGDFDLKAKKANYEFYEARCVHESSLSPGVHGILAAELGRHQEAYDYAQHAFRLDLDDWNRNSHEGLHTTSMAAAWLGVVYGFGGLRSDGDTLTFNPSLPKAWKAFSFRLRYHDSILAVRVAPEGVELKTIEGKALAVELFGKKLKVGADGVRAKLPKDRKG